MQSRAINPAMVLADRPTRICINGTQPLGEAIGVSVFFDVTSPPECAIAGSMDRKNKRQQAIVNRLIFREKDLFGKNIVNLLWVSFVLKGKNVSAFC